MKPPLKKRMWTNVSLRAQDAGFGIDLDTRQLMTPAKAPLLLPTRKLAEAVAEEWRAQGERIDPATMPMTRRANAAIDKVTPQRAEVAALLAEYGGSDLLCYRADYPEELVRRQAQNWDPILAWAAAELGAELTVVQGVMPCAQPAESLQKLTALVADLEPFALAGFYDLVALSGSLLLAISAIRKHREIDELWRISQVDEAWQAELWGADEEASHATNLKRLEFSDAFRFCELVDATI